MKSHNKIETRESRRKNVIHFVVKLIKQQKIIQLSSLYIAVGETYGDDRLVVDRLLEPYIESGIFAINKDGYISVVSNELEVKP